METPAPPLFKKKKKNCPFKFKPSEKPEAKLKFLYSLD